MAARESNELLSKHHLLAIEPREARADGEHHRANHSRGGGDEHVTRDVAIVQELRKDAALHRVELLASLARVGFELGVLFEVLA